MQGELEGLVTWLMSWIQGPYGMVVLSATAFAEASFLPVLPDVLLVALCLIDPPNAFLYAAICSVSSALGAVFGYGIGRFGGRPLLRRLVSPSRIRAVELSYQRYGVWPVAIAGFAPLPYKIFTITAGVFLLKFKHFVLASALGRTCRFFIIGALLRVYGEPVSYLIKNYFKAFAAVITAVFIIGFVFIHFYVMRNGKGVPESQAAEGLK